MLAGKNILLGVTGGIAVYKAIDLASKLVKEKANVKVIMTDSATEFVSPLTFRSITQQSVVTKLFDAEAPIEHISLADWSDIVVIAPATANIIGKIAGGIADDLLSTAFMAATSPKVIVPAMNVNMWENEIVQENINKLKKKGCYIVPPDKGRLACGYEGKGRFPEPEELLYFIKTALLYAEDLYGKTILISAGACREYLDPMRYLSNLSTGKTGLALARAAYQRGAKVILVHAVMQDKPPYYLTNNHSAITAQEMSDKVMEYKDEADVVIMNAAVTDYRPAISSEKKIKKTGQKMNLDLEPTVDVLAQIHSNKQAGQLIVGFAAETDNMLQNAHKKLSKCDIIAVNHIQVVGQINTELTILSKDQEETHLKGSKFEAAHQLLSLIKAHLN